MGSARFTKGITAVGIQEPRFTWRGRDEDALNYVQGALQPGTMVATGTAGFPPAAKPAVRGGQDTDLELVVTRTGGPGTGVSAGRFAQRVKGAPHWKGYTPPQIQSGFDMLNSNNAVQKLMDSTRIETTGEVIVVWTGDDSIFEDQMRAAVWTPATNSWASYPITGSAPRTNYRWRDTAVAAVTHGRVLAIVQEYEINVNAIFDMWQSLDAGKTWSLFATNVIPNAADNGSVGSSHGAMVWDGINLCWIRRYDDGANVIIEQRATVGLSSNFHTVRTWTTSGTVNPKDVRLAVLPGKRLVLLYIAAGALLKFRIVGSAWGAFEDAEEMSVPGLAQVSTASIHTGEDSQIHIYATRFSFGETGETYYLSSPDLGRTWTEPLLCWNTTNTADYPSTLYAIESMGEHVLFMQMTTNAGGINNALGAVRFGGWSEPEQSKITIEESGVINDYFLMICPWELPFNLGGYWAHIFAGGTWALDGPNGSTVLTIAGAADNITRSLGNAYVDIYVALKGEVISGGSGLADLGLWLISGNTVTRYFAQIFYSQTDQAFRVNYNEGGSAATVDTPWDFSTLGRVHIRASLDSLNALLDVWYKSNSDVGWTRVVGAPFALTLTANVNPGEVQFGSSSGVASVSEWEVGQVGSGPPGTIGLAIDPVGNIQGKAINSAYGTPLPGIGPDTLIARLHNLAGPAIVDELYAIDAVSQYPISAAYPDSTQKRNARARTADTGEHIVAAWDVGDGTAFESMYVYVDGNVASLLLEGTLTDWGSPVVIATYEPDVDFRDVAYVREGNAIRADTAGTSGARPIFLEEHTGGWVDLGGGKLREIERNTGGEWTTGPHADIAKARLYLKGIDGSEPTSGTCKIYSPRGVVIKHAVGTGYKKFRVKLVSGSNPWGYWELRYLSVGYLSTAGKHHARTWRWSKRRNAETREDNAQSRYVSRTGRAPRFFNMSWPNGTDMTQFRFGNAEVIVALTGDPLAAWGNVGWWALGLLDATSSGERMCVALPHVSEAGGTMTDPTLVCFGHFDSDAEITNALGEQGRNELLRVGGLSFREGV